MTVTVRFFANFREATGKSEDHFSEGLSVGALLDEIVARYGEKIALELYTPGKRGLRASVNIMMNGRALKLPEDLGVRLKDGDNLAIFPPVSGG